jgi:hypothetical protein
MQYFQGPKTKQILGRSSAIAAACPCDGRACAEATEVVRGTSANATAKRILFVRRNPPRLRRPPPAASVCLLFESFLTPSLIILASRLPNMQLHKAREQPFLREADVM